MVTGALLIAAHCGLAGQAVDSVFMLTGFVYDGMYRPVPATHVINIQSRAGDVSDTLGIFRLPVTLLDTLYFRNIVYRDTLVSAALLHRSKFIRLKEYYHTIPETRIFSWGNSYADFREAVISLPRVTTLGEKLGLPREDPDYIPLEMNEKKVRSAGFLLTSPVSFFYHNLSRKQRSARRLFMMERNAEEQDAFEEILSRSNISSITGLTGEELDRFLLFLNERIQCDYRCSELQIHTEIHSLWELYRGDRRREDRH